MHPSCFFCVAKQCENHLKKQYMKTGQRIKLVLILLVVTIGACQKTCTDLRSISYSLDTGSRTPKSDPSLCEYSKVVWYIPPGDTTLDGISNLFPVSLLLDGKQIGQLTDTATVLTNICDDILPGGIYITTTLPDGGVHSWAAFSGGQLCANDTIRASALYPCISVKITRKR